MRTVWGVQMSCVGLTEGIGASVLAGSLWVPVYMLIRLQESHLQVELLRL